MFSRELAAKQIAYVHLIEARQDEELHAASAIDSGIAPNRGSLPSLFS